MGVSTIGGIKKSEEKLRSFASLMVGADVSSKKVMRLSEDERLDEAIYSWSLQKRAQDSASERAHASEKASQLYAELHKDD